MSLTFSTKADLNRFLNQAGAMYNSATDDGKFKLSSRTNPAPTEFVKGTLSGYLSEWSLLDLGKGIRDGNRSFFETRKVIDLTCHKTPLNAKGATLAHAINAVMNDTFRESLFHVPKSAGGRMPPPSVRKRTGRGRARHPAHSGVHAGIHGVAIRTNSPTYNPTSRTSGGNTRSRPVPRSAGYGGGAPTITGGQPERKRGRNFGAPHITGGKRKVPRGNVHNT